MKHAFILLFIPVIFLTGCKGKAVTYNNKMVSMETDLAPDISKAETKIGDYYQNQDWDKMAKEAKTMENLINDKISDIKDDPAPDVDGADDFKKAVIKYFSFLKKIYTGYRKIAEAGTNDDRQTALTDFDTIKGSKDEALQEYLSAQKDFAKAANFKLAKDDNNTDQDDQPKKKKKTDDDNQ